MVKFIFHFQSQLLDLIEYEIQLLWRLDHLKHPAYRVSRITLKLSMDWNSIRHRGYWYESGTGIEPQFGWVGPAQTGKGLVSNVMGLAHTSSHTITQPKTQKWTLFFSCFLLSLSKRNKYWNDTQNKFLPSNMDVRAYREYQYCGRHYEIDHQWFMWFISKMMKPDSLNFSILSIRDFHNNPIRTEDYSNGDADTPELAWNSAILNK